MSGFRLDVPTGIRTRTTPQTGGGLTLDSSTSDPLTFDPQLSGNITVQGDADAALSAAGATNVLGTTPSFVDQFLNPELSSEQQQALDAFRKSAIGRGLSGEGLQSQVRATENRLLAGQKLGALRNLIGEIQSRADAFRGQISGFFQSRGNFGKPKLGAEAEQALLGGLTSLGFGGAVQGELFRRTGAGEAGRLQGLQGAGGLEGQISQHLSQIFNPRLTDAQVNPQGNLAKVFDAFRARGLDPALVNRSLAVSQLSSTLLGGLNKLQEGLTGLEVTALGGGLASPEAILNANLDPFQDLLGLFAPGSI